jgi:hypothetical protein
MIPQIKRWMTLKLGAFLGALAVAAIGGVLATKLLNIDRWELWDFLLQKEPLDTLVVLSPRLQYDVNGALSGRIRIALEKLGLRYRPIDREFPEPPPVVPSGEVTALIVEQGHRLLKQLNRPGFPGDGIV